MINQRYIIEWVASVKRYVIVDLLCTNDYRKYIFWSNEIKVLEDYIKGLTNKKYKQLSLF